MKSSLLDTQGGYYVSQDSLQGMDTTTASFDQNDSVTGNTNSANLTPASLGHGDVNHDAHGWMKHMSMTVLSSGHTENNVYLYKNGKQ